MGLGLEPLSTACPADLPPFPTNPLFIAWGAFHGADGGVWMLCQPRCFGVGFGMSLALRNRVDLIGTLVCPWPLSRWPKITR